MKFDHVGYRSYKKRVGEFYYAPNKVWITDAEQHPFKIEWLRYEDDSPVLEPVKSQPHVGFMVDNLEKAMKGLDLLLGPMTIDEHKRVVFCQTKDGAVVELMEVT
ncbi:MAG: hypothetical protein PHU24_09025 [Sphaerochaetaceae bacterium]|jgi:hypothetical protein|nr:hypothetical protein [Sphaerochaetaceae bacterium]NLO61521.1 hypothetical protein [Spirochaetales bacterium]MDD2406584.1 hypothetical protein [Sphaerochaetaceae bacterium]MDD4259706.1 hypothetical protein [Sphaerochaetaceae bacterium]MDD4764083.1 hypothetical protein [Sphaerochaetaceae bacterium]